MQCPQTGQVIEMCIADKHIKLCTCGDEIPEDNYWELFRSSDRPSLHVVGSFEPPPEHSTGAASDLLKAKVASDLNTHDCFDFAFSPQLGDVLEITVDGQTFTYQFNTSLMADATKDSEWGSASWGLMLDQPMRKGRVETRSASRP